MNHRPTPSSQVHATARPIRGLLGEFPALRRIAALALAVLFLLAGSPSPMHAQGCVPARFMALSLGPDGMTPLDAGHWESGLSVRYLYADQGWLGTNRWPAYSTVVGNQITVVSADFQAI